MRRHEVIGKAEPEPVNLPVKQNLNQLSIEDDEKVEKVQPVSVKHTEDMPAERAKQASVASVHDTKPQEDKQEDAKHNEEYAQFSQKLESEAKSVREADEDGKDKNYPAGEQE